MIQIDTKVQAGQNVFGFLVSHEGDEIAVFKRILEPMTPTEFDKMAKSALKEIKKTLFSKRLIIENVSQSITFQK